MATFSASTAHQQVGGEVPQPSSLDSLSDSLFGDGDDMDWDGLHKEFAVVPNTAQDHPPSTIQPLSLPSCTPPANQDEPVVPVDVAAPALVGGQGETLNYDPTFVAQVATNPLSFPRLPSAVFADFSTSVDSGHPHPHVPLPSFSSPQLPNYELLPHAEAGTLTFADLDSVIGNAPLQRVGNVLTLPSFPSWNPSVTPTRQPQPSRQLETLQQPEDLSLPHERRRHFISHRRENKCSISNSPSKFYSPIPEHPKSWGFNPETGRDTFAYTDKGELEINMTYSTGQIYDFIKNRPSRDGDRLILWIQNPPSQYNHRYPRGTYSSFCRWDKCPVKKHTIFKGQWRVALDEKGDEQGEEYDPFHNAGYLHLYCLETMFDLIQLFLDPLVDIRADRRRMGKEERNPMLLTRDHAELNGVLEHWKRDQEVKYKAHIASGQDDPRERSGNDFLYRRLTATHLSLSGASRNQIREERGGVHLGRYIGDLALYAKLKKEMTVRRIAANRRRSSTVSSVAGRETPLAGFRHQSTARKRTRREDTDVSPTTQECVREEIIVASPTVRKRAREDADASPAVPEQNSPKRRRLSVAGGQELAGEQLSSLQRTLTRPGSLTRRQSQAIHLVVDRLSSGGGSETADIVKLIQDMPRWKRLAVYNLAAKQASLERRSGSM